MGQFGEYIKMALYNIKENKGRSFLTMLGIIIGIASVITIVSIGNGLKADVMATGEVKSVTVMVDLEETTNTELITWQDIQILKESLEDRVTGIVSISQVIGKVETRKGSFDAYVTLTTPDEENDPLQKPVIRGTYFTEDDVQNGVPDCVLDKARRSLPFWNDGYYRHGS